LNIGWYFSFQDISLVLAWKQFSICLDCSVWDAS